VDLAATAHSFAFCEPVSVANLAAQEKRSAPSVGGVIFTFLVSFGLQKTILAFTKGLECFSRRPNFMAGLSLKQLVTLAGGQINASKFSYRPIFFEREADESI
jgi:hypothetical protein